jgi:ATP-dependent Clp protease protease subunit
MPLLERAELDYANLTLEALFMMGLDIQHRRVFLSGALEYGTEEEPSRPGQSTPEQVARGLLWLDKTPGEIELWINSPGGLVTEMFALHDLIATLENPVTTVGYGQVASAAGLILAAGKERYATPNCWFMSHMGEGYLLGDLFTQREQLRVEEAIFDKWAELLSKYTKHTKKWWREVHQGEKRELWLDAKGMVRHGIVDEIWPPEDDADE